MALDPDGVLTTLGAALGAALGACGCGAGGIVGPDTGLFSELAADAGACTSFGWWSLNPALGVDVKDSIDSL